MQIEAVPTMIDQFRETFEGETQPGDCWITDGPRETAVFGTIEKLTVEQAFAAPVPGGRSVAAHAAHLRYALDLTAKRMQLSDPVADWKTSFDVPEPSEAAWTALQQDLRRAYDVVLAILQQKRNAKPQDLEPIQLAGLAAITAHNAYHLGAIRQIANVVRHQA